MNKKMVRLLAITIMVLVSTSWFIWTALSLGIPAKHEKSIVRNVNSPKENITITIAESLHYSSITSLERFSGPTDPEAYLNPSAYLAYTFANYIDSETLDYYEARYDSLQGKMNPRQITLDYQANVTEYSDFRIYNSPTPEGAAWHNTKVVMSAPNGTVAFNAAPLKIFYLNQSNYQLIEWGYDFSFTNCYVVESNLVYSETYGSTAAFHSEVHQIVVLDRDYLPVVVGLEVNAAVA